MAGDTHFGGHVGGRAKFGIARSGVAFHGEWGITVCHRAGPFAVDGLFRNVHPAAKGPARLRQSRVSNVHTRNNEAVHGVMC